MIIHVVLFKLREQPIPAASAPSATSTDAATKPSPDQIQAYQEQAKKDIIESLRNVPGPLSPMQFSAPALPERAKGYNFGFIARYKDRAALHAYDISKEHQSAVEDVIKPRILDALDYDLDFPNGI